MEIGIVGLPNVGKSTLFNALTKAGAASSNYPFTTIDPNVGVALVPDKRLDALFELFKPPKKVPSYIKFVDIAGLMKGAFQGKRGLEVGFGCARGHGPPAHRPPIPRRQKRSVHRAREPAKKVCEFCCGTSRPAGARSGGPQELVCAHARRQGCVR